MSDRELTAVLAVLVAVAAAAALVVVLAPGTAALYAVSFGATVIVCALQWLRWRTAP